MTAIADALARVQSDPRYRVLHRIEPCDRYGPDPDPATARIGAVVDIETTGLDPERDAIVELAVVTFAFGPDGGIGRVLGRTAWLEDPGRPLPAKIARLTGLSDADLAGRRIDDAAVARAMEGVDLTIAHNAAFDRPFLEKRLPLFCGRPWACSLEDVDWRGAGFPAARLEAIATGLGAFFDGHRALDDAAATLDLLARPLPDGEAGPGPTGFARLLAAQANPRWRLWAIDAPYETKDRLKRRGYRWSDGQGKRPKAWYIDRPASDCAAEARFLRTDILDGRPLFALRLDPRDRFTARVFQRGWIHSGRAGAFLSVTQGARP